MVISERFKLHAMLLKRIVLFYCTLKLLSFLSINTSMILLESWDMPFINDSSSLIHDGLFNLRIEHI